MRQPLASTTTLPPLLCRRTAIQPTPGGAIASFLSHCSGAGRAFCGGVDIKVGLIATCLAAGLRMTRAVAICRRTLRRSLCFVCKCSHDPAVQQTSCPSYR